MKGLDGRIENLLLISDYMNAAFGYMEVAVMLSEEKKKTIAGKLNKAGDILAQLEDELSPTRKLLDT